jgi:hypothetical protein
MNESVESPSTFGSIPAYLKPNDDNDVLASSRNATIKTRARPEAEGNYGVIPAAAAAGASSPSSYSPLPAGAGYSAPPAPPQTTRVSAEERRRKREERKQSKDGTARQRVVRQDRGDGIIYDTVPHAARSQYEQAHQPLT